MLSQYKKCNLCPRNCNADRTKNKPGFCGASSDIKIATYQVHRFEEPPISGLNGSGTIFFSFCTARCVYCQNFEFSRGNKGKTISIDKLSEIMLHLQKKKCHNINLVTPTHYVPSIIEAIKKAKKTGLKIPIVYNSSGYELVDTLKMLEGFVDIYLPDAKYSDDALAKEHSGFIDYNKHNIKALCEMYRQVGNLKLDKNYIATKGIIIRHLVLPGYLDNTYNTLKQIAKYVSKDAHISLMSQYSPIINTKNHPLLSKRLDKKEYKKAKLFLKELGLNNGWIQN